MWIGKIEHDKGAADIPVVPFHAKNPFITVIMSFMVSINAGGPQGPPMLAGTPIPCVPFKSGWPPAQGECGPAECVMLPHTACR